MLPVWLVVCLFVCVGGGVNYSTHRSSKALIKKRPSPMWTNQYTAMWTNQNTATAAPL